MKNYSQKNSSLTQWNYNLVLEQQHFSRSNEFLHSYSLRKLPYPRHLISHHVILRKPLHTIRSEHSRIFLLNPTNIIQVDENTLYKFYCTINLIFQKIGFRVYFFLQSVDLEAAFLRIKTKNIPISTVIDIGASNGRWSRVAYKYYPTAFFFLIEANKIHEKGLQAFKKYIKNSDFVLKAAGDIRGECLFEASAPFGGVASHFDQIGEGWIKTQMTTVDFEVEQHHLNAPFLLKLDTHGFEIPILKGAEKSLERTNILIIEAYNFKIIEERNDCLLFYELCKYLETKGFRPIDLIDPKFRAKDQSLWQMDIVFIRAEREEFKYNKER